MPDVDFWSNVLQRRLTRRRAVAGASTLGAAAAFLAACGGSSNSATSKEEHAAKFTAQPVDSSKQAVKGGQMQSFMPSEGLNFDAPTGTAEVQAHAILAYSRLVKAKLGTPGSPPDGSVEGDAAQSWEIAPDGLSVTFKLRQGLKFEPRPPVNGRPVTSADVKYGWDRFAASNPSRGNWLSSVVPAAPVDRFEFPDAGTVVVKLSFPLGTIVRRFTSDVFVVQTEAADELATREAI